MFIILKVKKFLLGVAGFFGLSAGAFAVTNDAEAVNTALTSLSTNAGTLFDAVVPVILAVVGLGVLISMIKLIKKR